MKLNKLRPNNRKANISICVQIALSFPLILILTTNVKCIEFMSSRNQLLAQNQTKQQQFGRDVTNLYLTSDFRAVKLRWSYEHGDANQPASFTVRYCELTSWMVEIKCRREDMRVESQPSILQQFADTGTRSNDNSVIKAPIDTVHQLDPPNGPNYEAQIFDLHALTNYTFQVRVLRFSHEPANHTSYQLMASQINRRQRGQTARRLDFVHEDGYNETKSRVETKPFGAEATKCLADVSEVLINTGRYFGGRISVEDSADPRCNLIGNKSSEQNTYLFRIDHEICGSKVVDGNRIETMVLVHENKDILTHNTARFLVLCNFIQRSFTLKASVSLPKVNGVVMPSRVAVITSLPGRPMVENLNEDQAKSVMLGSMPGIYRVKSTNANETGQTKMVKIGDAHDEDEKISANPTNLNQPDELEMNTIEKFGPKESRMVDDAQARRPKELGEHRSNSNILDARAKVKAQTRSLTLSSDASDKILPQPVQVQSKVLYVERSDVGRVGRQQQQYNRLPQQVTPNLAMVERSSQVDTAESQQISIAIDRDLNSRNLKHLAKLDKEELDDLQSAPIIITNNHRISGDYFAVSQAVATKSSTDNNSYSIKYSAAKVDEYPFVDNADRVPIVELNGNQMRGRSGRMRVIEDNHQLSGESSLGESSKNNYKQPAWSVNRMGEMNVGSGDLVAETRNETSRQVAVNSSLARNITNYLLRWSVKTLTNLARKSLESLIKADNNETELHEHSFKENSSLLTDSELRFNQLELKRTNIAPETSKKPVSSGSSVQNGALDGILTSPLAISLLPAKDQLEPKRNEELLDGFITNSRRVEAKTEASLVESELQLRQNTRPGNYSKSLDFSRDEFPLSRRRNSEKSKVNLNAEHRSSIDQVQSPSHWNESAINSRNTFYASWLFYGIVVLMSLITGIFLAFWFVSSPIQCSRANQNNQLERTTHQNVFKRSTLPAIVYNNNTNLNTQNRNLNDVSHRKCDKFNSYFNDTSNESLLIGNKMNLPNQQSLSTLSQSTRSISANSTLITDENDCKNNEFLYTEHVLINTGSSFGESYA